MRAWLVSNVIPMVGAAVLVSWVMLRTLLGIKSNRVAPMLGAAILGAFATAERLGWLPPVPVDSLGPAFDAFVGWILKTYPVLCGCSVGGAFSGFAHNTAWTQELVISSVWSQVTRARELELEERGLPAAKAVNRLSAERLLQLHPPAQTPIPTLGQRVMTVVFCMLSGLGLACIALNMSWVKVGLSAVDSLAAGLISVAVSATIITLLMEAKIRNAWRF